MVAPNRAVAVPVQGITRIMKILFHSLLKCRGVDG
jgi:hypothetical protein